MDGDGTRQEAEVLMTTLVELWCATCDGTTGHETVPCPDGHGADCPDVVCTGCGEVAIVAVVLDDAAARARLAGAA